MHRVFTPLAAVAALALLTTRAGAQDKLKIGVIATLSGPPAVLGQQLRNGFQLAVKDLGGKLGGREVEIIVQDDELKPDIAVTKVKALLERDKVDFVVGPVFSNVLGAIFKPVTDANVILISPNAGTSNFAGKECNANFFVTSYQNDQAFGVAGKYAQDAGLKKVFLIAPNYQAGRDALAGFKSFYKGEIVDEVFVPLGQPRLFGRTVEDRHRQARRHLCVPARRHGHQLRQAVPPGGLRRQARVPVGVHGR